MSGHNAGTTRKQREVVAGAQLTLLVIPYRTPTNGVVLPPYWRQSHRYTQKCVTMEILSLAKLSVDTTVSTEKNALP